MAQLILPGDAGPGDVRSGKRFSAGTNYNAMGEIPDKSGSGTVYTVSTVDQPIEKGYTDGLLSSVKVKGEPNLVTENVRSGVTIGTVTGKSSVVDTSDANATASQILSGAKAYVNSALVTGTMPIKGIEVATAQDISGTTIRMRPPAGYYDGTAGALVTATDADYIASNILSGKNIFGLAGTAKNIAIISQIVSIPTTYMSGGASFSQDFTITGLSFTPTQVIAIVSRAEWFSNTTADDCAIDNGVLAYGTDLSLDLRGYTSNTPNLQGTASLSGVTFTAGGMSGTLNTYGADSYVIYAGATVNKFIFWG